MLSSIDYPRRLERNSGSGGGGRDSVRDLNDFLQVRRDVNGNFARHLSWSIDSEGPDNQKTHFATVKREPFGHSEN